MMESLEVQRFVMTLRGLVSKGMLMLFFIGFIVGAAAGSPFSCPNLAIFVFGESLTDTGNIEYLGLNVLQYPYGMSFTFPGSINPSRFSGGRLVIDFFGIFAPMPSLEVFIESKLCSAF